MSRKYICDVCNGEFHSVIDVSTVKITPNVDGDMGRCFEICPDCREKMFEPVKRYSTRCCIVIDNEDS